MSYDDFFHKYNEDHDFILVNSLNNDLPKPEPHHHHEFGMELWVVFFIAVGIIGVLCLLCRWCCTHRSRGRVLAPPAHDTSATQPPYPQQQYTAPYIGSAVTPYPTTSMPAAPYPAHNAFPMPHQPTPYPPHPTPQQSAPYHQQSAPYPTTPANAPSDAHPPSYDQVMGACDAKQPPYNPSAPM